MRLRLKVTLKATGDSGTIIWQAGEEFSDLDEGGIPRIIMKEFNRGSGLVEQIRDITQEPTPRKIVKPEIPQVPEEEDAAISEADKKASEVVSDLADKIPVVEDPTPEKEVKTTTTKKKTVAKKGALKRRKKKE